MRCPACAARNPDGAAWCSQCYAPLGDQREEAAVREEAPPAPDDRPATGADGRDDGRAHADQPLAEAESVRAVESGFEWRCSTCGEWNPFSAHECTVCGSALGELLEDRARRVVERDTGSVLLATAVLPGAGHVLLGRTADGAVRAVLFLLWVVGAATLLRAGGALAAAPLALGAIGLWVVSLVDAAALQSGSQRQLLGSRALLWLVVAVVGGLILALLPSMAQVGAGAAPTGGAYAVVMV